MAAAVEKGLFAGQAKSRARKTAVRTEGCAKDAIGMIKGGPTGWPVAVLNLRTSAEIVATNLGSLFVPGNPKTFSQDADGDLTGDGQWADTSARSSSISARLTIAQQRRE